MIRFVSHMEIAYLKGIVHQLFLIQWVDFLNVSILLVVVQFWASEIKTCVLDNVFSFIVESPLEEDSIKPT